MTELIVAKVNWQRSAGPQRPFQAQNRICFAPFSRYFELN
jgi:hypothetical protein